MHVFHGSLMLDLQNWTAQWSGTSIESTNETEGRPEKLLWLSLWLREGKAWASGCAQPGLLRFRELANKTWKTKVGGTLGGAWLRGNVRTAQRRVQTFHSHMTYKWRLPLKWKTGMERKYHQSGYETNHELISCIFQQTYALLINHRYIETKTVRKKNVLTNFRRFPVKH